MEYALEQLNKYPQYLEVSFYELRSLEQYLRIFSQCFKGEHKVSATPDRDENGTFLVRVSYYTPDESGGWPWRGAAVFYIAGPWLSHDDAVEAWEWCIDNGHVISMTNGGPFWG